MRPTKAAYMMHMAYVAATRGTCDRKQVGCVIVDSTNHVLSTGYNGSPPGLDHCDEAGHHMHEGHCTRTIHAEQNAIGHAARRGVSLDGATAYTTIHPCMTCAKVLATAGVSKVIYDGAYREGVDVVAEVLSGIEFEQYEGSRPWEK